MKSPSIPRMTKMAMNPKSSHCARSMPTAYLKLEMRQVGRMINVKSEVIAGAEASNGPGSFIPEGRWT